MNYEYYLKRSFSSVADIDYTEDYDFFLSSYNESDRVIGLFNGIFSKEKIWIILSEYNYTKNEYPKNKNLFIPEINTNEGEIIRQLFNDYNITSNHRLCIDITGFLRPHIAFLVRYLKALNFKKVDFVYTDPVRYRKKEKTPFSSILSSVEQVEGYKGTSVTDTSNDLLIICTGYDSKRTRAVADYKKKASKTLLFGLPALQADMFQENILMAYDAEDDTGKGNLQYLDSSFSLFAPANDPFITAQVISEFVTNKNNLKPITNLYLSPVSTKAQTLGMCLYYVNECIDKPVSLIFPYCETYERITTEGLSKIWIYTLEF
ncbi:hypothetical protein [Psychroserpens sp.]|uniref:hypothetical protein n=1 Tax=Psychroserpens sp. TaxID=2020870 RepID=UPI002B271323|nr:hypothetical protein [Psychroserpens sp.]